VAFSFANNLQTTSLLFKDAVEKKNKRKFFFTGYIKAVNKGVVQSV
jgi:hypothetical protein